MPLLDREMMDLIAQISRNEGHNVVVSKCSVTASTSMIVTVSNTSSAMLMMDITRMQPIWSIPSTTWPLLSTDLDTGRTRPISTLETHGIIIGKPLQRRTMHVPHRYQPAMLEHVANWHLKFSGPEHDRIETFPSRLKECWETSGLNDADILAIIPLLLTTAAKTWWFFKKFQIDMNNQSVIELRIRFGEPVFKWCLLGDIVNRTQSALKPGLNYLDDLIFMWSWVSRQLPSEFLLNFVLNGLRSANHSAIWRSDLFDWIYELARKSDISQNRCESQYSIPPVVSVIPEYVHHEDRYSGSETKLRHWNSTSQFHTRPETTW